MAADPKFSAGARLERKAFREYLRRLVRRDAEEGVTPNEVENPDSHKDVSVDASEVLLWVLNRQKRYDKKPSGLGRAR